jgi:hypothetical protein
MRDGKIQIQNPGQKNPDPGSGSATMLHNFFFSSLVTLSQRIFSSGKNFNRLAEICLKLGGKSTKFFVLTMAFYSTVTFASFSIDYLFYTEALLWHA